MSALPIAGGPVDFNPANRICGQQAWTVGLMHGDSYPGGDKTDNLVSRHRLTALADFDQHIIDTVDLDHTLRTGRRLLLSRPQ